MPPEYLAPGVYVEERPSGPRTIEGVATSLTAFIGRTLKGPLDEPKRVTSASDFESHYGGLSPDCPLTYAVHHYFANGGAEAVIARIVHHDATGVMDESAPITDADIVDPALEAAQRGLWLLDQLDLFNLLCLPPLAPGVDVAPATWNTAIRYAAARRAFVIVDAPASWQDAATAAAQVEAFVTRDSHAVLYFPRILAPDPLNSNLPDTFAPCGAVAGLYARTDATRGMWKAPAGLDTTLIGVTGLATAVNDTENDTLNPLAISGLRSFPGRGFVAWGARTLAGSDPLRSEYKYVPVRRTALFIEESLHRGLSWAVFEPNAEPLWAAIRTSANAFLHGLWRQGAFQGSTQGHSYFVKCDATTTTPSDISAGVVNILVGFVPLKPAEFVVLRIQQRTATAA
jgi:hypothetical protein